MIISGRVFGFLPSTSTLHFANYWPPGTNYPIVALPVVGNIISGDAGNGLCGGFVFTALDLFLHDPPLQPPAANSAPSGTPLFDYLVRRLLDSFGALPTFNTAEKVISWIQIPSHEVDIELQGHGLAYRMVHEEWPRIKVDIDAGSPSPLNLVAGPVRGAADIPGIIATLPHCHQVLAYAYSLDDQQNLTLWVYDCNDPKNDSSIVQFNITDPNHTIDITAAAIIAALGGGTVRGIFRSDYSFSDPSAIAGSAVPQDRAVVLSVEAPVSLQPQQLAQVSVTMKNAGATTWSSALGYRLGSQNPPDNQILGVARVDLPNDVAPGASVTFSFQITAPTTPGTVVTQWQMLRESVHWFGQTANPGSIIIGRSQQCIDMASQIKTLEIRVADDKNERASLDPSEQGYRAAVAKLDADITKAESDIAAIQKKMAASGCN